MKQDAADTAARTVILVTGAGTAWTLQDVSHIAAIIAALCTAVYGLVSVAFMLRKWYRLEISNWTAHTTDHGDLNDRKDRE
jgi:hypothetical protein